MAGRKTKSSKQGKKSKYDASLSDIEKAANDAIRSKPKPIAPALNLKTREERLKFLEFDVGVPGAFTANSIHDNDGIRLHSVWVYVTPEMASKMLRLNSKNRDLNTGTVLSYKLVLLRKQWHNSGDSICFDDDGYMTNAQHRLYGIVETGISAWMNVCFGVSLFQGQDMGRKRNATENIILNEIGDDEIRTRQIISIVTGLLHHKRVGVNMPTPIEITKAFVEWTDHLLPFSEILKKNVGTVGMKSALVAASMSASNPVPFEKIEEFYNEYCRQCSPDPKHAPILRLREWMRNNAGGGTYGSFANHYAYTQYALKCFLDGTPILMANEFKKVSAQGVKVRGIPQGNPWEDYDCTFLNYNDDGDFLYNGYHL